MEFLKGSPIAVSWTSYFLYGGNYVGDSSARSMSGPLNRIGCVITSKTIGFKKMEDFMMLVTNDYSHIRG